MGYAFISYAREDRAFVKRLADDPRAAGVDTWTDLEQIPAGASWQEAIETGLFGASLLIYVSSEHSGRSSWVLEEVRAVLSHNTQVIPIVIDRGGERNMPVSLRTVQWVDFSDNYSVAFERLLSGIRHLRRDAPVPVAEPKSRATPSSPTPMRIISS
jgi:hypothetical protein